MTVKRGGERERMWRGRWRRGVEGRGRREGWRERKSEGGRQEERKSE